MWMPFDFSWFPLMLCGWRDFINEHKGMATGVKKDASSRIPKGQLKILESGNIHVPKHHQLGLVVEGKGEGCFSHPQMLWGQRRVTAVA